MITEHAERRLRVPRAFLPSFLVSIPTKTPACYDAHDCRTISTMARRVPPANDAQVNSDGPPPSTLAAQIVQNQTRPAAPQQNGEAATFAQLLHEILNNPAAAQESDVRVNIQLVSVVTEAGLAPLALNNPFAQWDVIIPQANDSLAVIEKTVKRQPEILFTPVSEDGPQLALPLLARLVALCGKPQCDRLPIARLLGCLLDALTASAELWESAKTLQLVCQDLVDGT